jgi:esterase
MSAPALAHTRIAAPGAAPERWILFLHGIFGAGRNWATVARRLVRGRPEWGALLVDLRMHGASQGYEPPHTLAAAAADVAELVRQLELRAEGVLGHSFGGKVALQWVAMAAEAATSGAAAEAPGVVWVADSTPAAGEPRGAAWEMLARLRRHPGPFANRRELVAALVAEDVARPVAEWLSTNLEPAGGNGSGAGAVGGAALRWRLDLGAAEALLRSFFAADLWPLVEDPPAGTELHFLRATRSWVLTEEDEARLAAAAARHGRVHLHAVEGGHWLNADNPDAVLELLERTLPE